MESGPGLVKGARVEALESGARDDRIIAPPSSRHAPELLGVFGSFIAFGFLGRFIGPPVAIERAFTKVADGEPIADATEGPSGGSS